MTFSTCLLKIGPSIKKLKNKTTQQTRRKKTRERLVFTLRPPLSWYCSSVLSLENSACSFHLGPDFKSFICKLTGQCLLFFSTTFITKMLDYTRCRSRLINVFSFFIRINSLSKELKEQRVLLEKLYQVMSKNEPRRTLSED